MRSTSLSFIHNSQVLRKSVPLVVHRFSLAVLGPLSLVVLMASSADASVINIQPDETASADTFLYQGFVGTPSDAFFNFGNLGDQTPYKNILGVSKTTTSPSIHNTVALLQFDLSSLSAYTDSDIVSATLTLQATPGLGFYEDPSASWPVTIEAFAITGAWTESGVTWATQPSVGGSAYASQVVSGTSGAISFDLTQLVKDWKSGDVTNNGLELIQQLEVKDTDTGRRVGATFFGASAGDPTYTGSSSDRPLLQVVTVPEPATLWLMVFGSGLALVVRYRRKMSNRAMQI